jgi:hypothetical protein
VVLFALTAIAWSRTGGDRQPAAVDPWTDAGLQAIAAEVIPLVERHAGRTFLTTPRVAFAEEGPFQARLAAESTLIYGRVFADTPPEIREVMASEGAKLQSLGVLAKYGIQDRVTYICPQVIRDSLPQMGLGDDQAPAVFRLILAHELTHALTDQRTGLEAEIGQIHDMDGLEAASGAWEGVAMYVERQVALDLALTPTFDALTRLQGWGPAGLEDPSRFQIYATYGAGMDFTAWQFAHGGAEREWRVLASLPASTAEIFRPERWGTPIPEPPVDYAAVLRGLERRMTDADWAVGNSRLGELVLRGEAATGDTEADLDAVLEHLAWAQALTAERPDRQTDLRILEFDSPESVKSYLAILKRQQATVTEAISQSTGKPIDVVWEPFPDVQADESGLRTQRIPLPGGRWAEEQSAWVVRGRTCVVVKATGFRPGLRLVDTVAAIFDRLDAARASIAVSGAHSSP